MIISNGTMVNVATTPTGRQSCAGPYRPDRLIKDHGRDAKLIDWLDELTAECPKKVARNMNDPCGAKYPQLAKVL